jgi:hypothetical protein
MAPRNTHAHDDTARARNLDSARTGADRLGVERPSFGDAAERLAGI